MQLKGLVLLLQKTEGRMCLFIIQKSKQVVIMQH